MATWTSREVVSRRREWIVPAAQPWGATLGDLQGAIAAAAVAYRQAHGLSENVCLSDDALRITPVDDTVVISFTIEQEAQR